jgi:hypothetical protein
MIKAYDVFSEFVQELGEDFTIDAVNEHGVAFYFGPRPDMKFSIVMAPMFGIPQGEVGFVVTRNAYPHKDTFIKLEDPQLLEKIKGRLYYHIALAGHPYNSELVETLLKRNFPDQDSF